MPKADLFRIPSGEMRVLLNTGEYMVETDERTLWVNGPGGSLVGRFSPMGIDVHTDGQCVRCKVGEPSFDYFAVLMSQYHNFDVTPFRSELPWLPQ